jgi:hypothetical protein
VDGVPACADGAEQDRFGARSPESHNEVAAGGRGGRVAPWAPARTGLATPAIAPRVVTRPRDPGTSSRGRSPRRAARPRLPAACIAWQQRRTDRSTAYISDLADRNELGRGPSGIFLNSGQNTSLVLCVRAYETRHRALLEMPDPRFRHRCQFVDLFLQPSPGVER